jgi:hypothetical protein
MHKNAGSWVHSLSDYQKSWSWKKKNFIIHSGLGKKIIEWKKKNKSKLHILVTCYLKQRTRYLTGQIIICQAAVIKIFFGQHMTSTFKWTWVIRNWKGIILSLTCLSSLKCSLCYQELTHWNYFYSVSWLWEKGSLHEKVTYNSISFLEYVGHITLFIRRDSDFKILTTVLA